VTDGTRRAVWALDQYAERVALVCESGKTLTYRDLRGRSEAVALGVPQRCLIFVLCTNRPGSLVGYVGFMNAGVVPVLLDAQLDREQLDRLLAVYRPDYLWMPSEMAGGYTDLRTVASDLDYSLLETGDRLAFELSEELALLLTTSGSTGSRKLVRQSRQNIRSNMESIAEYLEIDSAERAITTLPMNYTFGLSIIHSHLHRGASIIVTEKTVVQREFWQQLKTHRATSLSGVPYTYEMLNRLRFLRMDLPALRTLTQAGGRLPEDLHEKFATHAANTSRRFFVMYGQTEATSRMSYLPHQRSLEKLGSIGVAIPGGQFTLVDANGDDVTKPDQPGELVYEGPNVTLGYAEEGSDLTLGDTLHGRLLTGDIATLDDDGFLSIVGRKKRFVKLFGSRVNLDETEQLLAARFNGAELACGGEDDNLRVYVTDPSLEADILSFLSETTHLHRSALSVVPVDQIPRTEAGKTIYGDLSKHAITATDEP